MKKILSIVWYKVLPARFGGQKGIALFNESLSRHFELLCLCAKTNVESGQSYQLLPQLPTGKSQFFNVALRRQLINVAAKKEPEIILLEHPYHGWIGKAMAKRAKAKLIVHSHNIEYLRFKQQGKWWWYLLKKYEKATHLHADLNLFKSAKDLDHAIEQFGLQQSKCMIVPYGVVKQSYSSRAHARQQVSLQLGLNRATRLLIFAGTLDYLPNARAVEIIYNRIAPALTEADIRVLIVGRNRFKPFQYLKQLKHPLVIQLDEVDDINLYYLAADVCINPVEQANGVQTKSMDALAAHVNLVCFENVIDQKVVEMTKDKIFLANSGNWDQFIQQIFLATQHSSPTPDVFFDTFSWAAITDLVAAKIEDQLF